MTTDFESRGRVLFTEPWEPPVVRRGDALGLRALTDEFADAVAPDLSNRIHDGRWVTILAWCLARSHEVFHARGGRPVATREEQRRRYAWLRPLELMWVARTIAIADDGGRNRSLAGERRVRAWVDGEKKSPPFGMTEDQFRRYRQTGMYGGYRLAFRKWPGMTVASDGWTPGPGTNRLAIWLDARLGKARPRWSLHADGDENQGARSDSRDRDREHDWWLRRWTEFREGGRTADRNTLPRRRDDFEKLPEDRLLEPRIFGDDRNGTRRRKTACEVQRASARDHIGICEHLGRSFADDPIFALLPRFSRLADAGMKAMDLISTALESRSRIALAEVAARPEAASVCDDLRTAARAWRRQRGVGPLRHIDAANRFAGAVPDARPIEVLRTVLEHHESHGGGLRWFVLRNGWIEPHTPWRGGSSLYRFRLWSLCRLAAQCGVLRGMPVALRGGAEAKANDAEEAVDE